MTDIPGFVIAGPPRTKKTHNRVITIAQKGSRRCRTCGHVAGFTKVLPSEQYEAWEKDAMGQCFVIKDKLRSQGIELPIAGLVSVNAQIYRDAARGDLAGYIQAIGDLLQEAGILVNDNQIEAWDGSRRLKDAARPRVEIFITVVVERAVQETLPL